MDLIKYKDLLNVENKSIFETYLKKLTRHQGIYRSIAYIILFISVLCIIILNFVQAVHNLYILLIVVIFIIPTILFIVGLRFQNPILESYIYLFKRKLINHRSMKLGVKNQTNNTFIDNVFNDLKKLRKDPDNYIPKLIKEIQAQ